MYSTYCSRNKYIPSVCMYSTYCTYRPAVHVHAELSVRTGTSQDPVAVGRLSLSSPVMVCTMKVTDCPFCLAKRFCGNEGRDCNT